MKILYLTHTDIENDGRIIKQIKALSLVKGYFILGYGLKLSNNRLNKVDSPGIFKIESFKFCSIYNYVPRAIKHAILLFSITVKYVIKGFVYKPEVVHCHDTMVLPAGVILKIICKSKLIYDAHELESQKNSQGIILSRMTYLIELISWRFVDFFITVSPSIVQWYEEKFGPKRNEIILNSPNYRELDKRKSQNESYFRKMYAISDEAKIFLYLGIIGKGRGVEMYLNIFESEGVSSHIVFMGYGDLVEDVINRSKGCNRIHFHPRVDHERVVEISQSADVGLAIIEDVSLSDYYCLPNKLFEYAFAGIPILASDFPDMKCMIDEYKLGAITKIDYQSVRDSIIRIQELGLSPSNRDLYPISWQNQSNKLLNVYKNLQ
jgi:glycosyltransferase involved in cell wall biosynthesis